MSSTKGDSISISDELQKWVLEISELGLGVFVMEIINHLSFLLMKMVKRT